ncbi:MAG TPA: hypothetical protein PK677_17680 [Acidiphilium sp.]|uniref:hypothetical protein n=1 Tax=unclassified Acidiphilium TaxID=2617493 RepID=UPI00257CA27A|nr:MULTISPECIES: hypothetical protein [unclassified Acidiphilium]HQT90335.1 hypothetical protein [Acidiphilium sp.]
MPIIRVYAPDQSPESKGSDPNTAAAVMGAMLVKASEPIEMLPVKPAQAKTEKTRPGNPNRLTLRQHVFPTKSISRFGNQNGLISVHDLIRKQVFNAKPTNVIFCADRAWDQRTEREMKTIEDRFQSLIAPVVAGLSRQFLKIKGRSLIKCMPYGSCAPAIENSHSKKSICTEVSGASSQRVKRKI